MTTDELIELKREAKKHAQLLEDAGLHRSRIYTLIHSDLPIVIDQLIRTNWELAQAESTSKEDMIATISMIKNELHQQAEYYCNEDVIKEVVNG